MVARLIAAPAALPVSVDDLKAHLRVSTDDMTQDSYIESLLESSVTQAEGITGRALMTQTWAVLFDSWQDAVSSILPYGQLQSVESVKYNDEDGTEQVVSDGDYEVYGVGTDCGKIVIPSESTFDYPSLYEKDPITITFVCGWVSTEKVPAPIKTAIKLIASGIYEDLDVENAVSAHLNPYRIWSV